MMNATKSQLVTDSKFTYITSVHGNMSTYMANVLVDSELDDARWVMSPIYKNSQIGSDFQPGFLTGTCKFDETPVEAAMRELQEELLLTASIEPTLMDKFTTKRGREWCVYRLDGSTATACAKPPVEDEREDDRNHKVLLIVDGTLAEIYQLLAATPSGPRGEDAIIGTKMMNLGTIRRLHKKHC